jgi:hypothetical protein
MNFKIKKYEAIKNDTFLFPYLPSPFNLSGMQGYIRKKKRHSYGPGC